MLEIFRSRTPVGSGSGNTGDSNTGTSEQESSRIKRLIKKYFDVLKYKTDQKTNLEKLIKTNTLNMLFYSIILESKSLFPTLCCFNFMQRWLPWNE